MIKAGLAQAQANIAREEGILSGKGVFALLRAINDPAYVARNHAIYMGTLRIGKGEQQPGVELVSAWYRRNARICANLVQATRPGDTVILLFGGNHAHLLRQCAIVTPGLELVEALSYLSR